MSKTILCVDDSVTMQKAAELTFLDSGYDFEGAKSADDGIAAAKKSKPALILVDAVMPGKSGYDLCKEIKANPDLSDVPVIMVCGNSEAYDESKGSEVGCDGHVTKPWDTTKLVATIGEFVAAGAKPAASVAAAAKPDAKPSAAVNKTMMGIPAMQMPGSAEAGAKFSAPAPAPAPAAAATSRLGSSPGTSRANSEAPSSGASASRPSMISNQPSKPIRLVLASQAEASATSRATTAGLSGDDAASMTGMSREVLEQIAWEVVPELAEAIIRENLETLTAKSS